MPPQKPRKARRGRPHRSVNPRILILCEGIKTEPNYFEGFKKSRSLTSVVVRPLRSGQVGPTGLLKRVREELRDDPSWDEVYCVLDHDGRDTKIRAFESQLAAINKKEDSCHIEMILSSPCFELWLLLHFEFTNRPFTAGDGRTICADVIKRLQRHLPGYQKNDTRIFEKFREQIDTAVTNSEKLQSKDSLSLQSHAPHTNIGHLIKRLLNLSDIR